MVVFVILLSVHCVVVLVFIVKVVVGVVGQVAKADGDDRGNVGVNLFWTPEIRSKELINEDSSGGEQRYCVLPPDEGLERLDAVLSELVIVNVTELDYQRNDFLQILP